MSFATNAGALASVKGVSASNVTTGANVTGSGVDPNAPSKEDSKAEARRLAGPWLHAWHDPVANTKALSNCVRLADLSGDGDYKLLIADADKKLKIFRGTSLLSEHALLDVPSALACFYHDLGKPQTPSVAVAAGPYVFIYRNLRPYYKFTLPPVDIEAVEAEIWAKAAKGVIDSAKTTEALTEARDNGVSLSCNSVTATTPLHHTTAPPYHPYHPRLTRSVLCCVRCLSRCIQPALLIYYH